MKMCTVFSMRVNVLLTFVSPWKKYNGNKAILENPKPHFMRNKFLISYKIFIYINSHQVTMRFPMAQCCKYRLKVHFRFEKLLKVRIFNKSHFWKPTLKSHFLFSRSGVFKWVGFWEVDFLKIPIKNLLLQSKIWYF